MSKVYLTAGEIHEASNSLVNRMKHIGVKAVYYVPRGGVKASVFTGMESYFQTVTDPQQADAIVDDLVDSGATLRRFRELAPAATFCALFTKHTPAGYLYGATRERSKWLVFPWELEEEEAGPEDNVRRLLQFVGEDPARGGLVETPKRVIKAWSHWCSGYGKNPADILKCFEDGAEGCDEMVVRKDIPLYSHCEHHMAAIIGKCTVAYIPRGKVVGLSKLDRLVDIYARRLQVQERMTNQIADALWDNLDPVGVGVWISARHMCVESRGIQSANSETITTALRGAFLSEPATRAEFLALARS